MMMSDSHKEEKDNPDKGDSYNNRVKKTKLSSSSSSHDITAATRESQQVAATAVDEHGWFNESVSYRLPQQSPLDGTKSINVHRFSFFVERLLVDSLVTPYQTLTCFTTPVFGTVLALDGIIQLTDKDEHIYHEMMVHVPLCAHPSPRRVLLVGGGDGGTSTRICRHSEVEKLVQVEIDSTVVEVCKRHFPELTRVYAEDARCDLRIGDGFAYVVEARKRQPREAEQFDVIFVDSSDPDAGPNSSLFTDEFYASLRDILRCDEGLVCLQAENYTIHGEWLEGTVKRLRKCGFPSVSYYSCNVPSYPLGQIG